MWLLNVLKNFKILKCRNIKMYTKNRISITIPPYLKEKLENKSKEFGCSQAEVLRTSFIRLLEAEK